jgi:hypothetical protein
MLLDTAEAKGKKQKSSLVQDITAGYHGPPERRLDSIKALCCALLLH